MKIYVDLDHVDITEYTGIESGEYNTNKINFIFTPEYKDLVKVAIFGCKLDTDEPKFYKIYLSDDSCYLPSEVTTSSDVISIGVYAFNVDNGELKLRYSPTPVKTIVYEGSFREEAENASSPTPTEIEQIMSRIISLEEITSDLNTRVETLENKACDLDSIKEDVETLKSDVENISGRLDTAESDIDELEGDIANTYSKTEVDTLLGSKVDTTTFNSSQAAQDEKIAKAELILSQLPKVTGEGTNISLSPTIEYDLEVGYKGDTIQEGTPTPETPVPIQVVTGTQEIEVCGKNMLNITATSQTKNNIEFTINQDKTILANGTGNSTSGLVLGQVYLVSGTTYRLSGCASGGGSGKYTLSISSNGETARLVDDTGSGVSYTCTDSGVYDVRLNYWYGFAINNLTFSPQVEVGSSATTYEAYKSQTYPVSLGTLELAKIGDYQDKIYYDNGKWYKYGAIGKYQFTGNETFIQYANDVNGYHYAGLMNVVGNYGGYCNYFTFSNSSTTWIAPGKCGFGTSKVFWLIHTDTNIDTVDKNKTWITTHKPIIYYQLATASTTEITNETLLSDLEYIRTHAMSYSGTTNISSSGDLSIVISASAIKQLS